MMKVFNTDKTDYTTPSLFLGEGGVGLFDTVNKQYPDIWRLYKSMKQLAWDENEFEYASSADDFSKCSKSTYDMMIKTLAFQWEADSVASRISPIVGNVVTSSELWAAWSEVNANECVHSACYSEIVRNSFKNPADVVDEILKVEESMSRLKTVHGVLEEASIASKKYGLGLLENNQEMYNHCFMFTVAMLVLERIQFMSSFAVTFAICDTGLFQPIGKAVQKIAQDESEVHVQLDKAVLLNEMKTERGKIAYAQCKDLIKKMIDEVTESELVWVDYLFSEGRELVGLNADLLKKWSLFCANDVYTFMGVEPSMKLPKRNPLIFMESWLDISSFQPSPQEEDNNQYRVGIVKRDDENKEYETDF